MKAFKELKQKTKILKLFESKFELKSQKLIEKHLG
jgi:hypothetical protein